MVDSHIKIRSGAPYIPNQVIMPHPRTFEHLLSVLHDETNDEPNDNVEQLQECIFSAIRLCERELFYFNESRDVTFQTLPRVGVYSKEHSRYISDSVRISNVYIDSGDYTEELEHESIAPSGYSSISKPIKYYCYNKQLFLYPVPDEVYTVRLTVSPVRLSEITDVNEYSPWFDDGFDLIKTRAKYEFYKNYQKDLELASVARSDYEEQLQALRAETHRRSNEYKLKPMEL